jgi:hypothetical protein
MVRSTRTAGDRPTSSSTSLSFSALLHAQLSRNIASRSAHRQRAPSREALRAREASDTRPAAADSSRCCAVLPAKA